MRTLLALALLFGLTACSKAQEKKPEAEKPKLWIGDPAPAIKVSKWIKGEELKGFEPGKVYVLDFWATWCGPCIKSMPHMNELLAEYKDLGLTVVAVTTKDPNNTLEQVESFIRDRGGKYGFTFAYCGTEDTDKAYMQAAGQDGIPCSFVIGKDGKIAFVGHPMELDDVLPKVIAGTWKGQADVDAIQKMNAEFEAVYEKAEKDPAAALLDLDAFAKKYPTKAKQDQYSVTKMAILLQNKKYDEAKTIGETLMKTFVAKKNTNGLNSVRAIWSAPELNPERKNLDLAIGAADAMIALEPKDPMILISAAEAYAVAGKKEKAVELANSALQNAESDRQREFLDAMVKKIKESK